MYWKYRYSYTFLFFASGPAFSFDCGRMKCLLYVPIFLIPRLFFAREAPRFLRPAGPEAFFAGDCSAFSVTIPFSL